MMNKLAKTIFVILSILFLVYLSTPEPQFPTPLWDFKTSVEPADQETPLRRGYFTNITREQLMSHYSKEFKWGIRLNYPPEEAQTLIRDQTKSSFLEEIVHPMRESLFVNGYRPKSNEEIFEIEGTRYEGKVIVKYIGSGLTLRFLVGLATIGVTWLLIKEWLAALDLLKWTSR